MKRLRHNLFQLLVCLSLLVVPSARLLSDSVAALPASCAQKDLSTTGRPVFGLDGKTLIGISMKQDSFRKGERITVNSWVVNPTGRPVAWSRICMPYTEVSVYDMQGREVVSLHQKRLRERQQKGDQTVDFARSLFL